MDDFKETVEEFVDQAKSRISRESEKMRGRLADALEKAAEKLRSDDDPTDKE